MAPFAWVQKITSLLPQFNQIPLFGHAPPFDWHQLSSKIASLLNLSHFTIQPRGYLSLKNPHEKLTNPITIPISIAPIGTVFWMISFEDMIKFTSWAIKPMPTARSHVSEPLQEGFYRYLILEVLDILQQTPPLSNLTLQLSAQEKVSESALCIDIEIGFEHKSCFGRLVISESLQKNWVQHFATAPSVYIPTPLAHKIELALSVKIGSVLLHEEEWKKIHQGDCLLLDVGSYNPRTSKGIAYLMLQSMPLFNVKIGPNKLELIDYAFYYEDTMQQENQPSPDVERMNDEGELVALKDLPLSIHVEIARLKMTLDQLMNLKAGNVLDLPIHPEQGVSLIINGEKVGRAELVYLGENLALRILQI